jgi:hypothetical protein
MHERGSSVAIDERTLDDLLDGIEVDTSRPARRSTTRVH